MAQVTWLGSDDETMEETTIFRQMFKKGEPVEIADDSPYLSKFQGNRYFKVESAVEEPVKAPKTKWPKI